MHQVTGQFVGRRRLASSPESGTEGRRTSAAITNQQTAVHLLANLYRNRSTNLFAGNPFPVLGMRKQRPTMLLSRRPAAQPTGADLGVVRSRRWCDICYSASAGNRTRQQIK
jgi:hypothetical protein